MILIECLYIMWISMNLILVAWFIFSMKLVGRERKGLGGTLKG